MYLVALSAIGALIRTRRHADVVRTVSCIVGCGYIVRLAPRSTRTTSGIAIKQGGMMDDWKYCVLIGVVLAISMICATIVDIVG